MKKILVAAALLFAGMTTTFAADRERPTTVGKLPAAAQQFLDTHFKGLTVAYAVEDPKIIGSEYEVVYTDRTQVDFENNGEWSSVERRYEAVPAATCGPQTGTDGHRRAQTKIEVRPHRAAGHCPAGP